MPNSAAASALQELADLLRGSGATSRVNDGRVAPSVVYDLQYRFIITSCAFDIFAKKNASLGVRWLRADKLKLLQFVAIRPWLVEVIREWSRGRGDAQMSMMTSDRLRRGFLSDATHDRIIELLVMAGALAWSSNGAHLVEGPRALVVSHAHALAKDHTLFVTEREALSQLASVSITNDMLEGW